MTIDGLCMKLLAWFQISLMDKELPPVDCATLGFMMILQGENGQNMFFSAKCRRSENDKG